MNPVNVCLQGGLGDGRLGEGRHAAAVQSGQDVASGFFEDVVGGVGEVEQDAQEGHGGWVVSSVKKIESGRTGNPAGPRASADGARERGPLVKFPGGASSVGWRGEGVRPAQTVRWAGQTFRPGARQTFRDPGLDLPLLQVRTFRGPGWTCRGSRQTFARSRPGPSVGLS